MNNNFFRTIVLIAILLVSITMLGQQAKKPVTVDDYHLWTTLEPGQLSATGKWVSYSVKYDAGHDSLFVVNATSRKEYRLNGSGGKFNGDTHFLSALQEGGYSLLLLGTGEHVALPGASSGDFTSDGKRLVTFEKRDGGLHSLIIRDNRGRAVDSIPRVTEFTWNKDRTEILYATVEGNDMAVGILSLKSSVKRSQVTGAIPYNLNSLIWSDNSDSAAFYAGSPLDSENAVYFYDRKREKLFSISSRHDSVDRGMTIRKTGKWDLTISDDGQKLFFEMYDPVKKTKNDPLAVQIWNGNDKDLYPQQQFDQGQRRELAVWWPQTGRVRSIIRDDTMDFVALLGNQDFALTGTSNPYDPNYKYDRDMDFSVTDLTTGESKIVLKQHETAISMMTTSRDGRYLYYYRDRNWWSYAVSSDMHNCITKGTGQDFGDAESIGSEMSFGFAGVTAANEAVLYDDYDMWLCSSDGKSVKRITKGREHNIKYRRVPQNKHSPTLNYDLTLPELIDLTKDIWLRTVNTKTGEEGYAVYNTRTGISYKTSGSIRVSGLMRAKSSSAFAYVEQRYDLPPRIVYNNAGVEKFVLYQSNKQHFNYSWGTAKLINLGKRYGKDLNAMLHYPAGYDHSKKYPMVVYIYEKISAAGNEYVNPSLKNGIGFNSAHLTANGYFVLLPDIVYEYGNTGMSAVECVELAVKAASAKESIDPARIGLLGQSFGGYQTNFILTRSNLFAAAVSGASIADVVSGYLSVSPSVNMADAFRYESQQLRLGGTLYTDMDRYLANSPIHHASKIKTPVLLFAGTNDKVVRHEQSLELYLALRRMKKQSILLLYPGEGHINFKPENQADLTTRVTQWFDYYLKGDKSQKWITDGTTW